jgi:signal transduction histidine kinase
VNLLRHNQLLIATVLLLWRSPAGGQVAIAPDPAQPARAARRYSLTSTTQSEIHDPTAWRLLASNNGGATWAVLDVKTNQHFIARSQRITINIGNRRPYSTYRLQIDAINSPDVSLDMSVQLAGFDLTGPMVNVPDESKLHSIVSASCAHPMIGAAEFAFDDDPTTAWFDYGLGTPGGCWIQIHYALTSKVLVTNLSQATLLTHVSAARARLADGGARVLSNLAATVVAPRRLTGYALTSANDEPGRDPRDWELLGSNDDGKTWTVVDKRVNELFTERIDRRVFTLTNAPSCRLFRLQIDACMATNNFCQIAEIEPLYADPQADKKYSLVVGAMADNPPLESTEMAFDGDFRSKWFAFVIPSPAAPAWIQWQLTPREEDLPVINQRQLNLLARHLIVNQLLSETNLTKLRLTGYALTSADDFPVRDPRDWKLLGSNDGGKTWDLLDRRAGEEFATRFQRRVFPLAHPAAYQTFRLQIDSILSPTNAGADSVQLAELEPLFEDPKITASLTLLVSSQDENAPLETLDHLFDGDAKTKWLDYSASSSNHASWIEWRYVKGPTRLAINMNREQATQALSPDTFELRLPATVLFVDQARAMAGLGDQTGFQWVHLEPWPEEVKPGIQMILNGELKIKSGALYVSKARAEMPQPLPAGGAADATQFYSSGSVTGRISGVFSGPPYCGATLTLSSGSSFEARLPRSRFPVPPTFACPVRIDGIIEDLVGDHGARVPSVIWASNSEALVLAPATEEDWNKLPDYSPAAPLPAPAHLRGTLERGGPEESVFIKTGTNRIALEIRGPWATATGSNVEAVGMLSSEAGQLILRNACLRKARPLTAGDSTLLTRISEVQQFIVRNPSGNTRFRVQGFITYVDLNMGEFYLQDGEDGLQVLGQMNAGLCPKVSDEGSYVELQGVATSGSAFATAFVHVLGKGRLPEPARPSWDYLLSGAMDNRWVEIEGIVTATDKQRIRLDIAGGGLVAWANELDEGTANSLAGSLVRVLGVCLPVVNVRNQRLGVRLLVPNSECIHLLSFAPEKPFDLPLLPMASVMSADPSVSDPQQRYARTRGVITCKQGRLLFLQDQAAGMRVTLRDDFDAEPGDVVEAVGRPQPDGFSAKLIQAVIRKVGRASVPAAVPVDFAKVNMGDLAEQQDATRVELEGVLVNESADATRRILNLRNEQARQVFGAYLPADDPTASPAFIPEGSRLRIRGIFKAIQDKTPDVDQAATLFEVYVNSSKDIAVQERPSWWTARHTLRLVGIFAGIVAVGLAWIWLLGNRVRQRTHDLALKVDELKRSEASLAAEVIQRKRLQADAEKAHQELLAVARQAGMAEVATGILHNVGNVLNSVNVSNTVVMDRLRNSRIEGIEKAVGLLRQNEAELETYLKTEKGRNLLPYLEQLAAHLAKNQAGTLKELEGLDKNIQHIKDIVAVQQDYARFSGLTEKLQVIDLMEDALRMTANSLERHKIQIAREFDPQAPLVEADRHKVLQILVNILHNAQQACDESGRSDKRVVLGIRPEGKILKVRVTDNGVGIAPENLDRVFNHGFTTRKNGHGFGLHNAALAAKEMGGALHVTSPGVGLGASFTLELPTKR